MSSVDFSQAESLECMFIIGRLMLFQANLAIQEGRLNGATQELDKAQGQLDDKQRELDAVQAMYDAAMKEKQVC